MNKQTIQIELRDQEAEYNNDDGKPVKTPFTVSYDEYGIYITPKGYGDYYSQDGQGIPIMVEFYGGEPRVHVWSDIKQQEATHHISVAWAAENLRAEESRVANDEFKCEGCEGWFDIEDSFAISGEYFCPSCCVKKLRKEDE